MALFHRRDAPPADVLAKLPRDERIVSWGDVVGGGVVLATPSGLWWPSDDGAVRPIGWHTVNKATWQDRTLTVIEAEVVDDLLLVDRPPVSVQLTTPRDLPPTIRKRIEANVVRSEVLPVTGGTARFVARRVSGVDGVSWWARLEAGTRDSPQVRSAVGARLAVLRADWDQQQAAIQRW